MQHQTQQQEPRREGSASSVRRIRAMEIYGKVKLSSLHAGIYFIGGWFIVQTIISVIVLVINAQPRGIDAIWWSIFQLVMIFYSFPCIISSLILKPLVVHTLLLSYDSNSISAPKDDKINVQASMETMQFADAKKFVRSYGPRFALKKVLYYKLIGEKQEVAWRVIESLDDPKDDYLPAESFARYQRLMNELHTYIQEKTGLTLDDQTAMTKK